MSTAPPSALELLERALGYTRVQLADVRPDMLDQPTPCAGWDLRRLLAHMEDALDAFTEAATGQVSIIPTPPSNRVEALLEKACALLGVWAGGGPVSVAIDDRELDTERLISAAALEITVHGWDVSQATGRRAAIPGSLALALYDVARILVAPADRDGHFAWPRPIPPDAPSDAHLLCFLGREIPDQLGAA